MLHKYIQIIIAAEADYCDLVNTKQVSGLIQVH